jgi:hypothetical protein
VDAFLEQNVTEGEIQDISLSQLDNLSTQEIPVSQEFGPKQFYG